MPQLLSGLKRLINGDVKCALCRAHVPKRTTIKVYEKDVCDWCVNYYSKVFPTDWKEKVRVMLC